MNEVKFKGNNKPGYVVYEIWRRHGDTAAWALHSTTSKQVFTDTPVTPGQYYEYKVRATASKSVSNFSNSAVVYGGEEDGRQENGDGSSTTPSAEAAATPPNQGGELLGIHPAPTTSSPTRSIRTRSLPLPVLTAYRSLITYHLSPITCHLSLVTYKVIA